MKRFVTLLFVFNFFVSMFGNNLTYSVELSDTTKKDTANTFYLSSLYESQLNQNGRTFGTSQCALGQTIGYEFGNSFDVYAQLYSWSRELIPINMKILGINYEKEVSNYLDVFVNYERWNYLPKVKALNNYLDIGGKIYIQNFELQSDLTVLFKGSKSANQLNFSALYTFEKEFPSGNITIEPTISTTYGNLNSIYQVYRVRSISKKTNPAFPSTENKIINYEFSIPVNIEMGSHNFEICPIFTKPIAYSIETDVTNLFWVRLNYTYEF